MCLGYLFVVSDFSIKYIAAHSNRDLPIYFKISSIWGGQEGSLLFWGWLLTIYTALVVIQNWRKHTSMMPYVTAVLMTTSLFFTTMHLFAVNPFNQTRHPAAQTSPIPFVPRDGSGLNPLLQDAYMVIHPPMLYLGLRRFRRSLRLCDGGDDHPAARRYLDSHDAPLDDGRVDVSRASAFCLAATGHITSWAGAASGPGIRWKMHR